MALIRCPECGKEISSNAAACPNCGNPVPKKMCPVHVERNGGLLGAAISCYVFVDGNMCGELKRGNSIDIELPVGSHTIALESNVRSFGMSAADTRAMSGEQFVIKDSTRSVTIMIKTKGDWTGSTGKCVVESVSCRE